MTGRDDGGRPPDRATAPVTAPRRATGTLRRVGAGPAATLRQAVAGLRRAPTALRRVPATLRQAVAGLRRTPTALRRTPAALRHAAAALSSAATRRRVVGVIRRGSVGPAARRVGGGLAIAGVALAGVILGVQLGARADADIGPFRAHLQVTPSLVGDSEIHISPLGSLHLDSHDGPAHLAIRFDELDQRRTEALIVDPTGVTRASQTAEADVIRGTIRLALQTLGIVILSTLALALLIFRDTRRTAWSAVLALAITLASLVSAVGTFRESSLEEPRYEGLLVNAPAMVGDVRRIADRYDEYAAQLQSLVNNVSRLYTTVSTLPTFHTEPGTTRVLHVSDLHLNPTAWSMVRTVVEQFAIDVVVDTGDITDWGTEPEATYVGAIRSLKVPYVYVRGNHDSAQTAAAVAREPNAVVLDDAITTIRGMTFAGIGDPRFTPDKETSPAGSGSSKQTIERVIEAGDQLAATIGAGASPVDIALVHDPASAGGLVGSAPLILAGHTHQREVRPLTAVGRAPARLLVSGSTGGAGLRGLESAEPLPLSMSVLYFDVAHRLQAHDDIEVGGTGRAQVTLERKVVEVVPPPTPAPALTPGAGD